MLPARRMLSAVVFSAAATLATPLTSHAQNDPALARGVAYLQGQGSQHQVGESALIVLALLKAEVPASDPAIASCLAKIQARFGSGGGYLPERSGGTDIYEAAVVCLALANLEPESRRAELAAAAQYLISKQNENGSWDYNGRAFGDTSISQYAVLGLWEASNGGVEVNPVVWDRAARWYLSSQSGAGSWNYHRDEASRYPETLSMTAAGVGSLLICKRQLQRHQGGGDGVSKLLKPLGGDAGPSRYNPSVRFTDIDDGVRRGIAWVGSHFSMSSGNDLGQSSYYALYGVERIGALADRETLGRVNWFEEGRRFIQGTQQASGGWNSAHGEVPNSVWAILFLTRSTAKSIRKVEVKRLGAGTLLGGRGLPKDLSNLTVAGGRVVSRPLSGAVEGMLAVLEDPRTQDADAALAGLVARYRVEGGVVLRPLKDRFRKMLKDQDPGLRRVAAWGLARTGELEVAPELIGALEDPDESVVQTAREGLQLLSRKIEGLGPGFPSTPQERLDAAARWRAWHDSVRPIEADPTGSGSGPGPVSGSGRGSP